jgi:phytoene dehydrogenase-like protein
MGADSFGRLASTPFAVILGPMRTHDALVVGGGFGGLAAALQLAERGLDVALLETLGYAGGCASTFRRGGCSFESGATLFAGFAPEQPFGRWISRHHMDVVVDALDPVISLRTPEFTLDVSANRDRFIDDVVHVASRGPDGHRVARGIRGFFAEQRAVADALWSLFETPELLPPLGLRACWAHLRRSPRYLPVLRVLGRPLLDVARRHGVADVPVLRTFLDAACQITVQAEAARAEAPFALSAIDYFWRGAGHVRGGVGVLASEMARVITALGGDVSLTDRVTGIRREGDSFLVTSRRGVRRTRAVVLNLLPAAARAVFPELTASPRVTRLDAAVARGWGAVMLYRVVEPPRPSPSAPLAAASHTGHVDHTGLIHHPGHDAAGPCHFELVDDPSQPFVAGNHVFVSISGETDGPRAPNGARTMTVSTHVDLPALRALPPTERGARIAAIQDRMRVTLASRLPEWETVVHELPASPRTFERFTARPDGFVGGIPRTAGWHNYRELGPAEVAPRVWLVGDSVFPGQSTLGVAIGGMRAAEALQARLQLRRQGTPALSAAPATPRTGHFSATT